MRNYLFIPYLILSIATSNFSYGQTTAKLGHINVMELLSFMPGVKDADAKLEEYAKQLDEQNTTMLAEYQAKVQEYSKNQDNMMDAIKDVKKKEILDFEERITTFQQSAQDKLSSKREELYNPILDKAEKAIKEVAKTNGYTYIFDTSAGSVVYFDGGDDVMTLVKKQLGIQ